MKHRPRRVTTAFFLLACMCWPTASVSQDKPALNRLDDAILVVRGRLDSAAQTAGIRDVHFVALLQGEAGSKYRDDVLRLLAELLSDDPPPTGLNLNPLSMREEPHAAQTLLAFLVLLREPSLANELSRVSALGNTLSER